MDKADEKNGGPNFLRAWRTLRGLSQAELAARVDTAPNMIQYLESGERGLSIKWLRKLAPALDTTASKLLDADPFENSNSSAAADLEAACGSAPVRNHLKAWRKHRSLTQEQVIDRLIALGDAQLPQTSASLSRLETGKQPYGERILEALAEIYQCKPWELIGRNPDKTDDELHCLATAIPPPQNDLAIGTEISAIRNRVSVEMKRRRLNPRSLSDAAGLTHTGVRDFLARTENPSIGTLLRLAEALQVDPRLLIFGDQPQLSSDQLHHLLLRIPNSMRGLAVRVLEAFIDNDRDSST